MIQFSFLPLKKLSNTILNQLESRYELEEVISLNSFKELSIFVSLFGGKLVENAMDDIVDVEQLWVITGQLKQVNESQLDNFYKQWLDKSKRENNIDEFCQLVSFNSFLSLLNKAKYGVVLQNSPE